MSFENNTIQNGTEYIPPTTVNDDTNDSETIAIYRVPGPFHLKEIFVSRGEIYQSIMTLIDTNLLYLENYSYFDDIKIYDTIFTMNDTEIEFPNSNIGPFAEHWFRNPNVFLNGIGKVEINFMYNNVPKQFILNNIDITGSLISNNGTIEWKVWCKPQTLYSQIQIIIDTYENIQTTFPLLNEEQQQKIRELKNYFNIIKEKAEDNFNYFNCMYNNETNN